MRPLRLHYPEIQIGYTDGAASPRVAYPDTPEWLAPDAADVEGAALALDSRHFSFIPEDLFDPAYLSRYLTQLGMPEDVTAMAQPVSEWKGVLVFSLELLKNPDSVRTSSVWSLWQPLLTMAHHVLGGSSAVGILAHMTPGWMYLIAASAEGLRFFNRFEIRDPQDALYFLLKSAAQINAMTAALPLMVSGHLLEQSPMYQLLEQYFGQLQMLSLPDDVPTKGLALPAHQYADLRTFAACVSSVAN